ncbi:MAG TPA: dTDP-4-amino-4,6-dideoxygalactose transaminase [Candidatus Binatia bacterium]|nr:dTDP-4-amino-4,6-dideoxygalactose transaminase [Candidatus Binatia bacterium]
MAESIPFNRPHLVGRELEYIAEAVARGNTAGDGRFAGECCRFLAERFGMTNVLLTPSCTAALEMAALLCGLGPGDEVIMPAFTFVSTANAFVRAGARPVFADIRPDTLNLAPDAVEAALTERTRAIVAVHYGGIGCDMDRLGALAAAHDLRVIEDAAHGLGASFGGRALGTIGDFGCLSFHETKNVHCGQGGALCLTRPADVARAEFLRDRGTNRQQFFRGEVGRYTWVDVGSAWVLNEILAAFLCAQLEALDALAAARARAWGWYRSGLAALERRGCLRLPVVPSGCETNHHIFHVLVEDEPTREALLRHLHACGIYAVIHYVPLHTAPFARTFGPPPSLPVTEDASARLVRLPLYHDLRESDADRVMEAIEAFFAR